MELFPYPPNATVGRTAKRLVRGSALFVLETSDTTVRGGRYGFASSDFTNLTRDSLKVRGMRGSWAEIESIDGLEFSNGSVKAVLATIREGISMARLRPLQQVSR